MIITLSIIAFFTAILTAIAGVGGGVLLIGIMALYLPPHILIPVHGIVQLSSCGSRAILLRKHIIWSYLKEFLAGALLGTLLGLLFEPKIDENVFKPLLGGFILTITWLPVKAFFARIPGRFFSAGCMQVYLSLLVGATGPLSSAVLFQEKIKHQSFVGTNAALMGCMHFLKICVFVWFGFSFYEQLYLLVFMVIATVAGSWVGSKITPLVSERWSKPLVKLLLTVLAGRLIIASLL